MNRALPFLCALGVALAGCSSEPPPTPVNEQALDDEPAPPVQQADPDPDPEQSPSVAEPPKVEPPVETNDVAVDELPDESLQTQEDADAVGLTTRAAPSSTDEDAPPAGNGEDQER